MFGQSALNTSTTFGPQQTATGSINPMKDFEVASPPDDTVSALKFSPATIQQNFLISGSWDSSVSIYLFIAIFRKSIGSVNFRCVAGKLSKLGKLSQNQ